ncbi:MAG: penicillin-resistant DD-carboxypeptidase [Thermoleophilia bacterium]|nr:penicillin-resistant DD-carboxypeptidase [Thermoleophilia bacterium]
MEALGGGATDRFRKPASGAGRPEHTSGSKPAGSAPEADVAKWVTGDTDGLDRELLTRLAKLGSQLGEKVNVNSGFRSRAEQEELYAAYKAGRGNLAAKPGTSRHESGNAADAAIGGTNLASNPKAKELALQLGLHFPVPGEPWHVEVKG